MRAWLALAACLSFGATGAQAITVSYSLSAQLAATASSGTDPLGLAGKAVSISGSVNSVNNQGSFSVSLGSLQVSLSGVTVGFAPGNPGSISISGQAAGGVPFSASIRVNVPSSTAAPFPSESIQGGSLSYGTPSTVIPIVGGSVQATSNAPSIIPSPGSLSFTTQSGVAPPSQTLALASNPTVPFTAAGNDSWVVVSPTSGQTGGSLTVSLNASAMPTTPGLHTSGITITSNDAANSGLVIPVSVTITSGNTLSPFPGSLSFLFQQGGGNPSTQTVTVRSSGAPLTFTAAAATSNGGNWLSVTPNSGTTTATLSVSANPAGLAAGNYSGTITLAASGSSVTVNVTLTVAASANLSASPSSLTFAAAIGGSAPPAQAVAISSKGAAANVTSTVSTTSGGNWLSVTPANGSTPFNLSVSVNPAGLSAGSYTGSISVSPGVGQAPLLIGVTLNVSATVGLAVTPAALNFSAALGSAGPGAQNLNVGGSGAIAFTVTESSTSGGPWFAVSQGGGTSPASLTVSVNLAGLAAGSYAGTVTITPGAGGGSPVAVPVALTLTAAPPALTVSKSALAFAFEVGGTAPAARTVPLTSTGSALSVNAAGFTNLGERG